MLINFTHGNSWHGKCVQLYQLLRGVRHWQISHCEILHPQGVYSYSVGGIQLGSRFDYDPGVLVDFDAPVSDDRVTKRAIEWHILYGDWGPINLLQGVHCSSFVCFCLGIPPRGYLPGQLYFYLRSNAILNPKDTEGGTNTPNNYTETTTY